MSQLFSRVAEAYCLFHKETHITCVFPGGGGGGGEGGGLVPTLNPHMQPADNLRKQFGPRSGPTFCPGLIRIQTVQTV